ncbi:MAG: hypothetical protein KC548_03900 [Nanoarchaeota archaeon]|nr:hypothetical protein [Nanoarchaeota archaeon]
MVLRRIRHFQSKRRMEYTARKIYGIIITLALIISLEGHVTDSFFVIFSIFGSLFVIALAEIYVHLLTVPVKKEKHLTWEERFAVVKEEFSIMLASDIPIFLFLLSHFGFLSLEEAFFFSKSLALLTLFFFGCYLGYVLNKKMYQRFFMGVLSAGFGFLIVLLKLLFK